MEVSDLTSSELNQFTGSLKGQHACTFHAYAMQNVTLTRCPLVARWVYYMLITRLLHDTGRVGRYLQCVLFTFVSYVCECIHILY